MGNILHIPPKSDGSQGSIGFDYQKALLLRHALYMLKDSSIEYIVCEFHEDMLQVRGSVQQDIDYIQIKSKTSTSSWTLKSLITPGKKQKKGILAKVFTPIEEERNVRSIKIQGCGNVQKAKEGELTLEELIYILKVPQIQRDSDWNKKLKKYEDYFIEQLSRQDISQSTIERGILFLGIDFSFPSPDAIDLDNIRILNELLKEIFQVSLQHDELHETYLILYNKIQQLSDKPNAHWREKSITRSEFNKLLFDNIREFGSVGNRKQERTMQDKLTRVGLENRMYYASTQRMNAMAIKFEQDIQPFEWDKYQAMIQVEIETFRKQQPDIRGPELWINLKNIFSRIPDQINSNNPKIDDAFFEGVFFDMTGICLAEWMRENNFE